MIYKDQNMIGNQSRMPDSPIFRDKIASNYTDRHHKNANQTLL